jgi:benzodiazapine receptor
MPTSTPSRAPTHPFIGLAGWLLLCFAAAALGGLATANAPEFYKQLIRPTWAPPAWLFGPVWSLLYATMAVSAWLVWTQRGWAQAKLPLSLFVVQLAANALWSWLFFAGQLGAVAFAEIVLLWLLIASTAFLFWRIHRMAALLLLPYLLWVSFAAALNFAMWQGNPGLL